MDPNDRVATVAGTRDNPAQEEVSPGSRPGRVTQCMVARAEASTIIREVGA